MKRPAFADADPFGEPGLLFEAILCPFCKDPVISVRRGRRLSIVDRADLSAIPEAADLVEHRCPGYAAHCQEIARCPR